MSMPMPDDQEFDQENPHLLHVDLDQEQNYLPQPDYMPVEEDDEFSQHDNMRIAANYSTDNLVTDSASIDQSNVEQNSEENSRQRLYGDMPYDPEDQN